MRADRQRLSWQVLIELQKTRLSGDILRFRRYLAERYMTLEEVDWGNGSARPEPLPLLCIYLLGFEIDPRLPLVTRVERRFVDAVGGAVLPIPSSVPVAWIEGLTHDAWFVQIPCIPKGANEGRALERFLSVFDQTRQLPGDAHRLDYPGGDGNLKGDELLRRVLRRLHKLQSDPKMERMMSAVTPWLSCGSPSTGSHVADVSVERRNHSARSSTDEGRVGSHRSDGNGSAALTH